MFQDNSRLKLKALEAEYAELGLYGESSLKKLFPSMEPKTLSVIMWINLN